MHVGAPDEPAHVSLGRHPYHIALLFAGNGIAVMGLDLLFGFTVAPGIFVGWTVYLVLAEEIHWRGNPHRLLSYADACLARL